MHGFDAIRRRVVDAFAGAMQLLDARRLHRRRRRNLRRDENLRGGAPRGQWTASRHGRRPAGPATPSMPYRQDPGQQLPDAPPCGAPEGDPSGGTRNRQRTPGRRSQLVMGLRQRASRAAVRDEGSRGAARQAGPGSSSASAVAGVPVGRRGPRQGRGRAVRARTDGPPVRGAGIPGAGRDRQAADRGKDLPGTGQIVTDGLP